jgi:hypothetical protein
VKKAWKALDFTMSILKKGNTNTKSLANTSLVQPFLKYGAACWDPYREGQKNVSDCEQNKQLHLHVTGMISTEKPAHSTER